MIPIKTRGYYKVRKDLENLKIKEKNFKETINRVYGITNYIFSPGFKKILKFNINRASIDGLIGKDALIEVDKGIFSYCYKK